MHVWKQQIVWLVVALIVMAVVVRIPIQWFEWEAIPAYVVGILALSAPFQIPLALAVGWMGISLLGAGAPEPVGPTSDQRRDAEHQRLAPTPTLTQGP